LEGKKMISEVIKNHDMSLNLETYWIPLRQEEIMGQRKVMDAVSIQIIWDSVVGTLDGLIELYVTNELNSRSLLGSQIVNSISNRNNSVLINLSLSYEYLKIKYSKNNILSGRLNVIIKYEEL